SAARTRRPDWVFDLAHWYRGGPLSTNGWAAASAVVSRSPTSEPGADPELVRAGRRADDWAGMPALTSQAAFIGDFDRSRAGGVAPIVDRVVYLRGTGPGIDPVIDVDGSIRDWRLVFPDLRVVGIRGRNASWHIPLIERPREAMQAIAAA